MLKIAYFRKTQPVMSPLNFNPSNDGYWGDTTATLDWCETNYEVSLVIGCLKFVGLFTVFCLHSH